MRWKIPYFNLSDYPIKRERGELPFAPLDSRYAMSESDCGSSPHLLHSSRQDLAALGTAAGKYLATVGSSHSLPETVNLGSVTPTGLIGTLQCNTPPVFHMLDSLMAAATHSARIYIRYGIITEITGQVNHFFSYASNFGEKWPL